MEKEEICVLVNTPELLKKAGEIITKYGDSLYPAVEECIKKGTVNTSYGNVYDYLVCGHSTRVWSEGNSVGERTVVSIDKLEKVLSKNYTDTLILKEVKDGETITITPNARTFNSGSKRDNDSDKPLCNHLDAYTRLRFGYLLRAGANKYDKGNWRLGQPTETALESLHRHLAKFELNLQNGVLQDEDHLSACIFNLQLIMKNEEKEGIAVDAYYGTTK